MYTFASQTLTIINVIIVNLFALKAFVENPFTFFGVGGELFSNKVLLPMNSVLLRKNK